MINCCLPRPRLLRTGASLGHEQVRSRVAAQQTSLVTIASRSEKPAIKDLLRPVSQALRKPHPARARHRPAFRRTSCDDGSQADSLAERESVKGRASAGFPPCTAYVPQLVRQSGLGLPHLPFTLTEPCRVPRLQCVWQPGERDHPETEVVLAPGQLLQVRVPTHGRRERTGNWLVEVQQLCGRRGRLVHGPQCRQSNARGQTTDRYRRGRPCPPRHPATAQHFEPVQDHPPRLSRLLSGKYLRRIRWRIRGTKYLRCAWTLAARQRTPPSKRRRRLSTHPQWSGRVR